MQLQVHLSEQHMITFQDDEYLEDVIKRKNIEKITLTAWF
jgi:hypothetical protein